jgi:Putative zinc-finger
VTDHLRDEISPLVDGQLDHDDRDRALAHLAHCPSCQWEVAEHRRLKARLAALGGPSLPGDVAARLVRMSVGGVRSESTSTPTGGTATVTTVSWSRPPSVASRPAGPPPRPARSTAPRASTRAQSRRPAPHPRARRRQGRTRRMLVGSAVLMLLSVTAAALGDGRGAARLPDPVTAPTAVSGPAAVPSTSVTRFLPMMAQVSLPLRP